MFHNSNRPGHTIKNVSQRPVFWADLGKYFRELREAKATEAHDRDAWSLRNAGRHAARRGIPGVNYQLLQRLESGKAKYPDPEALRGVAALYGQSYEKVAGEVVKRLYGVSISTDAERHQRTSSTLAGPSHRNLSGNQGKPLQPVSTAVTNISPAVRKEFESGSSTVQQQRQGTPEQVVQSVAAALLAIAGALLAGRMDIRAARRIERVTRALRLPDEPRTAQH